MTTREETRGGGGRAALQAYMVKPVERAKGPQPPVRGWDPEIKQRFAVPVERAWASISRHPGVAERILKMIEHRSDKEMGT